MTNTPTPHADSASLDTLIHQSLAHIQLYEYQRALDLGLAILAQHALHDVGLQIVGLCQLRLGNAEQALPLLEQALHYKPQDAHLHWQLAQALQSLKHYDRAIRHFDRAQELGIIDPILDQHRYETAGLAFNRHCHWLNYDRIQRLVRQSIYATSGWVIGESTLASPYFGNATILAASRHYGLNLIASLGPLTPFTHPTPSGKIRLGFVGSDFFEQATAYLMVGFIEALDRSQFELYAYEHGPDREHTPFRQRVINAYDHFVRIEALDDQAAAQRIHDDNIDILFSIKNPGSARLGIFARRPAAIQVHYLYYPATSGLPFFDYIVGDEIVTPVGCETAYSERILRIAGCYQPNDDARVKAHDTPRSDWGLPVDAIIMANFNQTYKHTPDMFDLWCQLLKRDERRILWLIAENPDIEARLRYEATTRGIAPQRVVFGPKLPSQAYLNRLRQADLILDTYPYGGHTLTSDALWSGTPVVTLCGETYASRVAASLLHDVGMPDLIAHSELEYLRIAERLLSDATERQHWRRHLDQGRDYFPLFNAQNYAWRFANMVNTLIHPHSEMPAD
jgi:predicted O-linked N-acetylglucosamine transferase (SPINDLY family)